jgi:hypothetical protein
VHDALSNITEKRKMCMPFDGTMDFWVILVITGLNLFTVGWGLVKLDKSGEIVSLRGTEQENIEMIALVFALVEATPGILFIWCASYPVLAAEKMKLQKAIEAVGSAPLSKFGYNA